jgi:hypothetical protein
MEDQEIKNKAFTNMLIELTPLLHIKFYVGIGRTHEEKEPIIKDLIQETAIQAWINSCKPELAHYDLRGLILVKADNILSDYLKKKRDD